jgi:hypothetical protein
MFVRRLLVPVDLSSRSAHALAYACELAAGALRGLVCRVQEGAEWIS